MLLTSRACQLIYYRNVQEASLLTHHVLQVDEGVIDGHNLHLLGVESSTGHQTTNTAKSEEGTVLFTSWPLDGAVIQSN